MSVISLRYVSRRVGDSMLSIQEAGMQILGDNPGKFYIFGGTEYGIKQKYISVLVDKFGKQIESPSVKEVIDMLSKKHIIPLEPAVYVIRYDESFLSEVSDAMKTKIDKLKFEGTIICIYESPKHISKLQKSLGDYLVMIDTVSPQFVTKYLKSDFPELNDKFIAIAVKHSDNYNQAKNMCFAMNCVAESELDGMNEQEIARFFGCSDMSTETQIRIGVASRNFKFLVEVMEKYEEDADRIFYAILQTLIDLDKLLDNNRLQLDIQKYVKNWTRENVYYMFMNTYAELKKSRSGAGYDIKLSLIYLFGLLKFQPIPSPEVMNS